jgi:hypothetical protein
VKIPTQSVDLDQINFFRLLANRRSLAVSHGLAKVDFPEADRSGEICFVARSFTADELKESYGIRIGEVRIFSPTPAMISVGVTVSSPFI